MVEGSKVDWWEGEEEHIGSKLVGGRILLGCPLVLGFFGLVEGKDGVGKERKG